MQEPDIPSTLPVETEVLPHSAPSQASPVGLLTHAAQKAKARVVKEPAKKMQDQPVAAAGPSTAPITPPVASPSKKHAPQQDSSDSSHNFNDNNTPTKKVTEMPPGVAIPSVLMEGASPPQQNRHPPPSTTGEVCLHP
jgi:hypothetical protein